MRPYTNDLRQRIIAAVQRGDHSLRQIAALFAVSLSCVVRLLQRFRQTGSVQPRPHPGRAPRLDAAAQERLLRLVHDQPDATLAELRDRLGIPCCLMTIARVLQRLGITRKKKTVHAQEQDSPRVQAQRQQFRQKLAEVDPEHLVFVDETGANTSMQRTHGRAPRGQRVHASVPGAWESLTLLVGLRPGGVVAPVAVPGPVDGDVFQGYVEQTLVPQLRAGDVVLLDHLQPHQRPGVRAAIEAVGARLELLPVYSPDLNPIEEMFSKVKSVVRSVAARTTETVIQAMGEALRLVTQSDILGWFRDRCSYAKLK